ncbi:hypothetical protein CRG98_035838 [Punica granatum]|uniref:G-patch domain-containing protein n=1 Tax=Punica granatum TaxID=22663 RepID=A0A2I0IIC7_PUNGR|nr:hypothetical protein CRG98_035838 [Punica granatum]
MAAIMAELLALLRGPNRASSSTTPPPGQGPTVDPTPSVPPTQAPENMDAPMPPTLRTSMAHPFTSPFPPPPPPTVVPLPPAAFLTSNQVLSAQPPVSMPAPAAIYTVPPPMVFLASSAPAPTHPQVADLPSYPPPQPHINFSYQAPPPINTTFLEPGTPIHAAQVASPTHFFPEADDDLFPGMRLPPKFKIPEFKTYGGTTDPRHHLRHYRGKMLQHWGYEEFVIHSFQDSLSWSALDWFMSLKAEDIPTWADLSRKFIDQYQYCAEAPPTLLELSTKEMARGQRFEEYATKWRAQAAKHIPPISEAQQIQLFHSTLRGIYYSHLLAYTSSFFDLIEAGKKLDLGIKLGRMEGPASKGEESSKKVPATSPSSGGRRGKEPQSICYSAPPVPPANDPTTVRPQRTRADVAQAPGVESSSTGAAEPYLARPSSGSSINMISICASGRDEDAQDNPLPFAIDYTPEEPTVGFAGRMASPAPFVVDIPAREPYADSKVPWTYEGSVGSVEQQFSVMGMTRSGRVYENPAAKDKGKAPATEVRAVPESSPFPSKRVTEEEAEAFMKNIKASEYKVVEQMAKSPAHISLLALLLNSEPPREALLRVLTAAQIPKETPPDRIEETVSSIFSNTISFSDDELPSEGWSHSRALHIVCKCNNYIIGRMNVDLNRVRPSKTAVRAFDGSRREVNGEIDLLIDVGPCSFSITFQVLDIPNAISLLLGRPWIHSAGAVPSSLHQSVGDDENLSFHSFETISVIRDYGESGPSRVDRMIGKVLLCNNYIPGTGLGAREQGISRPIEIEEYRHRRGLGFRPSCHEIIETRSGNHLHRLAAYYGRLNRGTPVPPLSHFFPEPSHTIGGTLEGPSSDSDDTPAAPSTVYAVTDEIPSGVHIRLAQENEELDDWISFPRYSAMICRCVRPIYVQDVPRVSAWPCATQRERGFYYGFMFTLSMKSLTLHPNPSPRHFDSNLFQEHLGEPQLVYFGEGLPEDSQVPEIEESLRHLEDHQITSVEPTEEIKVGTKEEPRTLKIGIALDPTQQTRMIDFLKEYQEVFAWSYADMPGLDPSIVEHFLPLDTEKFSPKRQQLRRQRASLLLRIKEEVVKQINVGFLEVCNYSEWVANIVPVEKKDGRVRVCVDYRDLNKASPKDNFPLPHIDVLVDNTARHTLFSFMDGFSGYNQIRMAEKDKLKTTFTTMWGTFCYCIMPFDLKNVGATYQRAMVTLFHDMMHKEVEVYVDDMIAKSKEGEDHVVNLKRLFDRLKEYKLRLNRQNAHLAPDQESY